MPVTFWGPTGIFIGQPSSPPTFKGAANSDFSSYSGLKLKPLSAQTPPCLPESRDQLLLFHSFHTKLCRIVSIYMRHTLLGTAASISLSLIDPHPTADSDVDRDLDATNTVAQ